MQLVSLDVLPEGVDDHRPSLGVQAEQASQSRVQLELHRLKRIYTGSNGLLKKLKVRAFDVGKIKPSNVLDVVSQSSCKCI